MSLVVQQTAAVKILKKVLQQDIVGRVVDANAKMELPVPAVYAHVV
jgi:hypothetical protein